VSNSATISAVFTTLDLDFAFSNALIEFTGGTSSMFSKPSASNGKESKWSLKTSIGSYFVILKIVSSNCLHLS
jgi:hypothetical protein